MATKQVKALYGDRMLVGVTGSSNNIGISNIGDIEQTSITVFLDPEQAQKLLLALVDAMHKQAYS